MSTMPKSKSYKYKFSFVMPVYNVENYLAETVESILAQTMDFEQNCEIIFVNDASPDNSEEVCLRYKKQFPNNIKYVKQENAGPGAARNNGIDHAEGKYISLLDSDDKISPDTLQEVYDFFEKHYEEIDLIGIKQLFFEARKGEHPMSYKFTSNRVIDLDKDFTQVHMPVTASFFKSSILKKHRFDPHVGRYAEDTRLVAEILLDKHKYGIVSKPIHYYRKRADQASSLDTTKIDKFWYLETPKRAWYDLFKYTSKKADKIPKFIQFIVMYDLQWRIKQVHQTVLSAEELKEYKSLVYGLLSYIDDDVIMAQRHISLAYKLFTLKEKHQDDFMKSIEKKNGKYSYRGTVIFDPVADRPSVSIDILDYEDGQFTVEGHCIKPLIGSSKLIFSVSGKDYETDPINRTHKRLAFLGDLVSDSHCFRVKLPALPGSVIRAYAVDGEKKTRMDISVSRFSYLNQMATKSYRTCADFIISKTSDQLTVSQLSKPSRMAAELRYWAAISRRLKLSITRQLIDEWKRSNSPIRGMRWAFIPPKSMLWNVYVIMLRAVYFSIKPFFRRPVWIVSDRVMAADDNGEVLFRYLSTQSDVPANVYFALSKKSSEFTGVQKYGKVVNYNGFYYKLLFLLSDKIISSEAADYVINPFKGHVDDFVDLFKFDFVFLQHGIIKDDISGWLNRYDKNIKLFITSTKPEYESILNGDYGYDKNIVKLTGLPRYDLLKSKPKRKLLLMPTWRDNLAGGIDPKDGRRLYNPNFKKSEYFAFYQNLINDDRIKRTLKKHKFIGELYLHPSFQNQIKDFTGNEQFKIMQMPFDYPKAKREGNLLVTDYSSVAFDFAYLKKPVIYTHFDEDSFYKTHTSREGYFSYEKDGFGLVVYNYENTVEAIIKMIESGCKMPKRYQNRVENFFYRFDQDNSKRVYEEIKLLNKTR